MELIECWKLHQQQYGKEIPFEHQLIIDYIYKHNHVDFDQLPHILQKTFSEVDALVVGLMTWNYVEKQGEEPRVVFTDKFQKEIDLIKSDMLNQQKSSDKNFGQKGKNFGQNNFGYES